MSYYYGFRPYVPVAKRRQQAAREMEKLKKQGRVVSPVVIEGRTIARNFWGKAWCENLERYSDYENRLPRGRTYVRNGSVVDLQIERGKIRAMVSGSEIYSVKIEIGTVSPACWKAICKDCARFDRLARRIAAGEAVEERDGAGVPGGRRPVSEPRAKSR